jgi:hypothetical protein
MSDIAPGPKSANRRHCTLDSEWNEPAPAEAALLLVLYDTVDFIFGEFDCQRSTYSRYTGFVFAVAEFHFPSPTAIGQLNNGVFYSLMFHRIISSA